MDAPEHMKQRQGLILIYSHSANKSRLMVDSFFTKTHIDLMQPYIQKTVEDLLDKMLSEGCKDPVDLVNKFALPVPSYVSSCDKGLVL